MTVRDKEELDELLRKFYRHELMCGGDCAACKFGVKPQNYFWFTCPVKVTRDMIDMRFSESEKFEDMVG
jgi:ferredoxin